MLEIRTEIEIDAPPHHVWAELANVAAHQSWNPFITHFAGELREGARLAVTIQPPGGKAMSFSPVVLAAQPDRELRWRGRVLLPGVFDGEHYFRIEPLESGRRSRFVHGERFSGVLVPFLEGRLQGATRQGFVAMNEALKRRVETAR
jgi:hypothetical protein